VTPRGIVLHTVGVAGDATVAGIRKYHVEHNGWRDIGYHFLIRKSGTLEKGRPLDQYGAHLEGANDTIGICVAGDGDHENWTLAQRDTVVRTCAEFCRQHGWIVEQVIGHREGPRVFNAKPVSKTCPGKLIDMGAVRSAIANELALPFRVPV
jgi:N-acetylmuramoyl-L-alanine amidase-like protein